MAESCGAIPPDEIANAIPAAGACVLPSDHPAHPPEHPDRPSVDRVLWHSDEVAYMWNETHWRLQGPITAFTEEG